MNGPSQRPANEYKTVKSFEYAQGQLLRKPSPTRSDQNSSTKSSTKF